MEEKSFATIILEDYKRQNKRLFAIVVMILLMLMCTGGYLIYILNDIGTIETTQEIEDVETIENSNIVNGDNYGEDNTN